MQKYSHRRNLKYTSTRERGSLLKFFVGESEKEEADFILRSIRNTLDEHTRNLSPGDIGILYRSESGIKELINALRQAELPFCRHTRKPLIQTFPFTQLFSLFNFMLNQKDITSLADILLNVFSEFQRQDIQSIFLAGNRQEETLNMLISRLYQTHQLRDNQYTRLSGLFKHVKKLKKIVFNEGIAPALIWLWSQFPELNPLKYGLELQAELLSQRALEYEFDLKGFLQSFYLSCEDITSEKNKAYIHFVPLGKIKGREFKLLFIPGLEEGNLPAFTRDFMREARLFYLALNRAREEVVLTAVRTRNGKKTVTSSYIQIGRAHV